MKISFNWLKDYIQVELSAPQVAEILTDIGLEVEGLEKIELLRGGLEGVIVGEVLTCERHPDADKLSLTTVHVGGDEPLQIVCGAPNVAAGQKVLVATVGAMLYPMGEAEGFKIKKSKIRGQDSLGMICAEDELGLGSGHAGIMVLPSEVKVGTPARDYFNIEDDYMIEIGLTPNRADAASHYGVARDLAVYCQVNAIPYTLTLPDVSAFGQDNNDLPIAVEVLNPEAAPRYMGLTMTGVRVAPSPEWLQRRLRTIGINPKNNIVDITNYVLHELGQPLHAFDTAKINGSKVVVRTCVEGMPFVTLDGVERKLSQDDLMICSADEPMCIAGVFGGEGSGVTDQTSDVFLESAYFNPVWVRKTARRHGLNTDASFRFERGIDPNITAYALRRAALLIKELAGGSISSSEVDLYPVKIQDFRFEASYSRIRGLIGKEIANDTIRQIILALEIKIESEQGDLLQVAVPPYRVDVQREADLVEDVLRIYGYNNIEIPHQVRSTLSCAPSPDKDQLIGMVSDLLTAKGFNEIMSNSLTKGAYYENLTSFPPERCIKVLNPLSNDLNVMRQTLLFNALEAAELNINHRNADLKLYEFGNCYFYAPEKVGDTALAPYCEQMYLSMLISGAEHHVNWNQAALPTSFFSLKGVAQQLFQRFGIDFSSLQMEGHQSDLYSEAIQLMINTKPVAILGVVHAKIRARFGIKPEVYFMELNFDRLLKATRKHIITVSELSKYPEVRRDLALLVDESVTFAQLRAIAFATEKKLLKNISLFDVYEGNKLPAGKKSYALNFVLEDPTKTLVDQVIDKTMNRLIAEFETKAGAQVRN